MNDIIIIMVMVLLFFLFMLCKQNYNVQNEKKEIISKIQNILDGKQNEYQCYEETELSEISYLLKCLEEGVLSKQEKALKEKESLKYMISNLSHQLKTPLSNVKMYQEFLENETLSKDQQKNFQKKLKSQIDKIEWILESIIKCTRLEEGIISFTANMYPICETIIQAMDSVALKAANKDIDIISTEEITDIEVYHNSKWTREVFENILENAIKYSPCHSIIKINVEQLETYTKISFEDNGIGIRENEYLKIFQRFYRSKDVENAEGSGIGLYLCRLILENEKGNIVVKSEYGKGSVFSVYLLNKKPK